MRACSSTGCQEQHYAKSLCFKHYQRAWRAATPEEKEQNRLRQARRRSDEEKKAHDAEMRKARRLRNLDAHRARDRARPDYPRRMEYHREKYSYFPPAAVSACWALQEGRCALCKTGLESIQKAHADHCHSTNKPRGLLCRSCNLSLGKYERLREMGAEAYLADPPAQR